jgi:anti-sigma regulatory factor (Ser/Thr protein kinase)
VTNAIRHGGATDPDDRVRLRVLNGGPRVRVEVRDDGPGFDPSPRPARRPPPGEGGIGLELVAGLADAWGADREGSHTVVWFEVEPARPGSPVH